MTDRANKNPVEIARDARQCAWRDHCKDNDSACGCLQEIRADIAALEAAGKRIVDLEPTEAMSEAAIAVAREHCKPQDHLATAVEFIIRAALAAADLYGESDG